MKDALREETQFWLVTPKASLAGVSGLDALVGGNYIGMMPGKGKEAGSLCRTTDTNRNIGWTMAI